MTLNKGKILAVDDTPANLEVIEETLSDAGYDVATAIDGDRAINRLETYQPDLILLDVKMPGIDGFETCRRIKNNLELATIPIIFITAFADLENKMKGFSLGSVDYITKPFQTPEMLARIDAHIRLRRLNNDLEREVSSRTCALDLALKKLQKSQLQLVQNEKMASLGNLVAGIAHEINNPIGFLNGSIQNTTDYIQDLFQHLDIYQQYQPPSTPVQNSAEEIDLDFIVEDLPKMLDSMQGATDRIKAISNSLRTFSRADTENKVRANPHEGLDSTLLILKYRLKANEQHPEIKILKDYDKVPTFNCFPGQLNQVFMNILANAIDAFDEANQGKTYDEVEANPNVITITTSVVDEQVEIQIQDNGCGMRLETVERIFEQGFTTKEVGKGTGLGMAIAHQIITEKHGGTITCQSEPGQGTEFTIVLPIA